MSRVLRLVMLSACLLLPDLALAGAGKGGAPAGERRININTADAELLDEALAGIGPARARAIVAWRQQHGAFRSLDELRQVRGLGPSFIERNRDRMRLQ